MFIYECDPGLRAVSPLREAFPREEPRTVVGDALARLGLDAGELAFPDMVVPAGDRLVLPSAAEPWGAATIRLTDTDLRRYKQRVGRPDPEGPVIAPPELAPDPLASLAFHFVFVDSRAVAEHRRAIERRFREFPATLITAGRVELGRGAHLTLRRGPVLLLARALVLDDGAELRLETAARVGVDHLLKRGSHVIAD